MSRLGDLVEEHREAFIRLLITEQGKGRAGAEWEIGGSILWLREIATETWPVSYFDLLENATDIAHTEFLQRQGVDNDIELDADPDSTDRRARHVAEQIARLLALSPRTVEAHRARLMKKLGAASHGELVARLVGAG